jgi:uncharacterized protein (DUF1330 family)
VYVVIDISEMTKTSYKWLEAASAFSEVPKFGGRYLTTATSKLTSLDGTPPEACSIIAFESQEQAQAWEESEIQKTVTKSRKEGTKSRSFMIEGLAALPVQAEHPVFLLIDVSEIIDQSWLWFEGMGVFMQGVEKFGGRYLAHADKPTAFDGAPPVGFSIIAFDSLEQARAWDQSEAQKIVTGARTKKTKSRSFIVEGR